MQQKTMFLIREYDGEKRIVSDESEVIEECEHNMNGIESIEELEVVDIRSNSASPIRKVLIMDVDYQHTILYYSTDTELVQYLMKNCDQLMELDRLT